MLERASSHEGLVALREGGLREGGLRAAAAATAGGSGVGQPGCGTSCLQLDMLCGGRRAPCNELGGPSGTEERPQHCGGAQGPPHAPCCSCMSKGSRAMTRGWRIDRVAHEIGMQCPAVIRRVGHHRRACNLDISHHSQNKDGGEQRADELEAAAASGRAVQPGLQAQPPAGGAVQVRRRTNCALERPAAAQ